MFDYVFGVGWGVYFYVVYIDSRRNRIIVLGDIKWGRYVVIRVIFVVWGV